MRIAAAGDLVLMRHLGRPAESLLACLEGADLVAANLEVPLTSAHSPVRKPLTLRADPELIDDLVALGVNVVTLANNHAGDQGTLALRELAAALEGRGVCALGLGFEPRLRDGVALVAATCVGAAPEMAAVRVRTEFERDERTDGEPGWPPRIHTVAEEADSARLESAVADARSRAPFVVVLIHWGVSHVVRVEEYQRQLARRLVAAGAGLILGCHAHVLQAVEVIEGVPVFYGLGTLLFHYDGPEAAIFPRDACLALVDVSEGRAVAARLVIGRLDDHGEPVRAHPARVELVHEILRRSAPRWMVPMSQEGDELVLLF